MTIPIKPIIVIIPGFEVHLDDLPSASGAPSLPPADLAADATHFRKLISNLVKQGKFVTILAHSFGGLVAREALIGAKLDEGYRKAQGQQGGVNRIIYLSSLFSEPPNSCVQFLHKYIDQLPWLSENITDVVDPDTEGGPQYLRHNPIKAAPYFFNDLSEAEAIKWTVRMSMHTMAAWFAETHQMDADAKRIPVSFVKCLKDMLFSLSFQDEMIRIIAAEQESVGMESKIDVREIDGAHLAPVSCPDGLARLVEEIVLQNGK